RPVVHVAIRRSVGVRITGEEVIERTIFLHDDDDMFNVRTDGCVRRDGNVWNVRYYTVGAGARARLVEAGPTGQASDGYISGKSGLQSHDDLLGPKVTFRIGFTRSRGSANLTRWILSSHGPTKLPTRNEGRLRAIAVVRPTRPSFLCK